MKKIFYTLFVVSLLAVGCTQEVGVSRDHDIDAEVTDMQTKMEMSTLYCNLNESNTEVNLDQLALYLTAKSADVTMFVAPTSVNGTDFKAWLDAYAAEQGGLTVLEARNEDNVLTMAALVNPEWSYEKYDVAQGIVLSNAVLHFKANDIHFVVTELNAAKNAIPADWQDQVAAMTANKTTSPFEYNPDNLAARKIELSHIIKNTVDNKEYLKDSKWIVAMNANAASHLDIVKYEKEFLRENYYDGVSDDFDWNELFATETNYFSIDELLAADDIYFNVSNLANYYDLIDCNAVHHSVYTPSTVEGDKDGVRNNFLYATSECWNMFQTFDFDTAVASELGVAHYPMIVTLKIEE
jgi:hypothetical protein